MNDIDSLYVLPSSLSLSFFKTQYLKLSQSNSLSIPLSFETSLCN